MRRPVQAAVAAMVLLVGPTVAPVTAAGLVVDTLADTTADDGACSLREAIDAANSDTPMNECPAGSGADTITFSVAGTIILGSRLPQITSDLVIDGAGAITVDGAGAYRLFTIISGTVVLDGLTVTGGFAKDAGLGGGIYNFGNLTLSNSTISGNSGSGICNSCRWAWGQEGLPAGTITITHSTISGNSGSGINNASGWDYIDPPGAAPGIAVTLSTISGNGAGGISNGGVLRVVSSTISGNGDRGGISNLGVLEVIASTISGNGDRGIANASGPTSPGTATVTTSTISGNSRGGISNTGSLEVVSSMISGNTAGVGGGIYNSGHLIVAGSTISGNTAAADGGGVINEGNLAVTNSVISGNIAGEGGGIENSGVLRVASSTISGNTATFRGGAILDYHGTLEIANSTITGNTAGRSGGGIYSGWSLDGATLSITNSTITGNTAGRSGGGFLGSPNYVFHFSNSIVAGNSAADDRPDGDAHFFGSNNLIGVPEGLTLADILDPAGLTDNGGPTKTIALVPTTTNPAIDAGDPEVCAAPPVNGLDQRGLPRPAGACDIGAYEHQGELVAPFPSAEPSPSPRPSSGGGTGGLTAPPTATATTAMPGSIPVLPALLVLAATLGVLGVATRRLASRRDAI